MSRRVKFLLLLVVVHAALLNTTLLAAVRTKEVCASVPFGNDLGKCYNGVLCKVGVRGAFLDLTSSVSVSGGGGAVGKILSKGTDADAFGCIPDGQGREGFVEVEISGISSISDLTIRLLRPNAFGGIDADTVTVDVKKDCFIKRETFNTRVDEQPTFLNLEGNNLQFIKVLHPELGDEVLGTPGPKSARVRLNFTRAETVDLRNRLDFLACPSDLNDANGWPQVVVRAASTTQAAGVNVTLTGTGGGSVVSQPTGINCPFDCNQEFPANTTPLLTATPNGTSKFVSWAGSCAPPLTNPTCTVTSTLQSVNVSARFDRVFRVRLNKTGTGGASGGKVTSTLPASANRAINCDVNCSTDTIETTSSSASITLTAEQAPGHTFAGWTVTGAFRAGTCGTSLTCTLDSIGTVDRIIEARFNN